MRTPAGTGEQGNIQGLEQQFQEDLFNSAAAQTARIALMVVKDTVQFSLADIGRHNVWEFGNDASRPTLPLLVKLRAGREEGPIDDSWKGLYQEILNFFPEKFRALFQSEMQQPLANRRADFIALDYSMQFVAKMLAKLNGIGPTGFPNKFFLLANIKNLKFIGQELQSNAETILSDLTANHPGYEEVNGKLKKLKQYVAFLDKAAEQIENETFDRNQFSKKLESIFQNNGAAGSVKGVGDFQSLDHMLCCLDLASTSILSNDQISLPLLLGLTLSDVNTINTDANAPLGNSISLLTHHFAQGIGTLYLEEGGADKFEKLLAYGVMSTLTLINYISSERMGALLTESAAEAQMTQQATAHFVLKFILGSGLFHDLCSASTQCCGVKKESDLEHVTTMSELYLLGGSMLIASQHNDKSYIDFFGPFSSYLIPKIDKTVTHLEGQIMAGHHDNPALRDVVVMLKSVQNALKSDDIEQLSNSIVNLLGSYGIDRDRFEADIQAMNQLSDFSLHALSEGLDDKTNRETNVVFAA